MSIEQWEEAIHQKENEEREWMKTEHAADKAQEWEVIWDGEEDQFAIMRETQSKKTIGANVPAMVAKLIAEAHNASITAERDRAGQEGVKIGLEAKHLLMSENLQLREQLATAKNNTKHYRDLFDEIRQAVKPITPTDASKKEIIDCVKSLVSLVERLQRYIKDALP